jgi:23S rRNA (adenine2503-C2)-methyltransferase
MSALSSPPDQAARAEPQAELLPGISAADPAAVEAVLVELGQPRYRVSQLADAVWRSPAASWDECTTLSRSLRAELAGRFRFDAVADTEIRLADGGLTEKALHRLVDGRLVESVLMRYPARDGRRERHTLCISSQAGCAVGCPFCATGELGFGRDLAVAEIVDQVRHAARRLAPRGSHLTNLVFMGMGEPLLVLDAVLEAAAILTDPARFGLGARHVAISTSGVVPGIERLTALRPQWTLAVSLHAARDPLRDLLVPLNRRWPVATVVAAAGAYQAATGRRVSYEHVLIDGINDTPADAAALVRLLAGSGSHLNLIPMNPVAHTPWGASPPERVHAFATAVRAAGIGVTVRRNRGQEIGAACGQLAAERAGEPAPAVVAGRRDRLVAASAVALRSVAEAQAGVSSRRVAASAPRAGASRSGPADARLSRTAGTSPSRRTR